MKKSELREIIKEEIYKKGLYQAKVGDPIWIGRQGNLGKSRSKIKKILPDGKLVDEEGNIFLPNGRLFRGKNSNYKKTQNPGKEVSAQLITQKEYDKEYKEIKIDFLRKFDYHKLDISDIEKIIDAIPNHRQVNKLSTSRFEK